MEERGENTTLFAGAAERQFQDGKERVPPVFFVRVGKAFGMRELQVYEKWECGSD
jgi:hypothetical protein